MARRRILHPVRPSWRHHVWAYNFAQARAHDGRAFRMLTVIDQYSPKCPAIAVARRLRSDDVLQVLAELCVRHGAPDHIRSDNGSEFAAKTLCIAPSRPWPQWARASREEGRPWGNAYNKSFNDKLRDELLDGEIFYNLKEARVLTERRRRRHNSIRPHSAPG